MVVTPKEALKASKVLGGEDRKLAKKLEYLIDRVLNRGSGTDGSADIDVNIDIPKEYDIEKIVSRVVKLYEKAGWEVDYNEGDSETNSWLRFYQKDK